MSRLALAAPASLGARDALTHALWGAGLGLPAYLHRELALRAHPFARAALRSWAWEDGGRVLASCETYQVASFAGAVPGRALVVASVFTEAALRGQGHAGAMLRALQAVAAEEGAQALVLFSEVGPRLYARLGYRAVPSLDWLLPARPGEGPHLPAPAGPGPGPAPAPGALVLRRDPAQVGWHLERERLQAEALGVPRPRTAGAALPGGAIGWTAFHRARELHVLWLDAGEPAVAAALLRAAQRAAAEAGLARVRHWAPAGAAPPPLPGLEVVPRDDEVPMVLPLAPGVGTWAAIERASWA